MARRRFPEAAPGKRGSSSARTASSLAARRTSTASASVSSRDTARGSDDTRGATLANRWQQVRAPNIRCVVCILWSSPPAPAWGSAVASRRRVSAPSPRMAWRKALTHDSNVLETMQEKISLSSPCRPPQARRLPASASRRELLSLGRTTHCPRPSRAACGSSFSLMLPSSLPLVRVLGQT